MRRGWVVLVGLALLPASGEPVVHVACDRATAVYAVGETVRFSVRVTDGDTAIATGALRWRLSHDGVGDLGAGQADLAGPPPSIDGGLGAPGVLRLEVTWQDGERKANGLAGAAFDPYHIAAADPPTDFRWWWDAQKALLAGTPATPELTENPAASTDQVEVNQLAIPVLDGGRIRGWYCKPKAAGRYPAVLSIPGAGVSATPPAVYWAQRGWLSVNVSVHDQPLDEQPEFYQALQAGPLAGYPHHGRESRETYYYRRVFLGLVRCVDFLTAQPEWDGRNLVVVGSSQGGGSTLALCGLDERVTCGAANVPAMCYHAGVLVGRASGWPRLIPSPPQAEVVATAGYYDAANFARYIRCPVFVTVGLVDRTCPPSTVFAAYNAVPNEDKELVIYPELGHAVPPDWGDRMARFIAQHRRAAPE